MRATLVLMLLMAFTPRLVSATAQIPDEIVIDGASRALFTEPEPFVRYLDDSGQHAKLKPNLNGEMCTASWRGCKAYWEIRLHLPPRHHRPAPGEGEVRSTLSE